MKTPLYTFILAACLTAHSATYAQVSLLRVSCEGNDVGAEVSINGKFKGECPLDVQAGAGTLKLRVAKKVDSSHERVFEQELRMSDGVVKRVEALLGPVQLSTDGRRIEGERLASEHAQALKRKQVRETAMAAGLIPPRPQLPFEVSEDIWQRIEASEVYRNQPRPRPVKVSSRASRQAEYTGSKIAALPKPAVSNIDTTIELKPLGEKCMVIRNDTTSDGKHALDYSSYLCGGSILLGGTFEGRPSTSIKSIDELTGYLFPMRIGNRMSYRTQMAYMPDRKLDSAHTGSCEVIGQGPAGAVDSRLIGVAWKVHCQFSNSINSKTNMHEYDDYYLEDLGVMLSNLGAVDSLKKAAVLPSPGTQTLFVAEGEYGSRQSTTYSSYDWTVGK